MFILVGYFLLFSMYKNHYYSSFLLKLWILPLIPQCSILVTGVTQTGGNLRSHLCLACFFLFFPYIINIQVSTSPVTPFFPLYLSQYIQIQGLIISYLDYCCGFLPGLIFSPVLKFVTLISIFLAAVIVFILRYRSDPASALLKTLQ